MTLKSDANDLRLQIWHEEFGEISPNDSKVWKFVFDGLFVSKSVQGLSYKNTEDLTFMTLNKWSKIWINLDLQKMAWGTRWTFIRGLKSQKKLLWWVLFAQSIKWFSKRISWELCVITLKGDAKLKENWLMAWKMTLRSLKNFLCEQSKVWESPL